MIGSHMALDRGWELYSNTCRRFELGGPDGAHLGSKSAMVSRITLPAPNLRLLLLA